MEKTNHTVIQQWANTFGLLAVFFLPFPLALLPLHSDLVHFLFKDVLVWFGKALFGTSLKDSEISSDSTLLYLQILFLGILALLLTTVFSFSHWFKRNKPKFVKLSQGIFAYYLAFQLLNYGFDKLFKAQFYLPEPNILYTPFGQMSKDLLFWSTMGLSYEYNIFTGLVEVLPAVLIFFRRTRVLGVLIALGVLTNVLLINFSFDISVKIYSFFLCFLCIILLLPYLKVLYEFFVLQKQASLKDKPPMLAFLIPRPLKVALKTFVIGMIFLEVLLPYFQKGSFNDDLAERPFLHGAYEVQSVWENGKRVKLEDFPIKRLFIHRYSFLVFQNKEDNMQDFKLSINKTKKLMLLQDYQDNKSILTYDFSSKKQLLALDFIQNKKKYRLEAKTLEWKKLPALQKDFHWFID